MLEHVPEPTEIIGDIRDYLTRGGVAIVTESFHRVEPRLPTHLACNKKYAGRTEELFVEEGFRVVRVFERSRPMVFKKVDASDGSRFESLENAGGPADTSKRWYPMRRLLKRLSSAIIRRIPF